MIPNGSKDLNIKQSKNTKRTKSSQQRKYVITSEWKRPFTSVARPGSHKRKKDDLKLHKKIFLASMAKLTPSKVKSQMTHCKNCL